MQHMAYPTGKPLASSDQISVLETSIRVGDTLALEYPNNSREEAQVTESSVNILEIDVGGKRWRLAPIAPHEPVLTPMEFDKKPLVVWVIQPK